MFQFIPAWYGQGRPWYDPTTAWYRGVSSIHFDDTINQMRMFQHTNEDIGMVLLNYMPNLRYFLHRYDLFEVPYWSVFDEIQHTHHIQPQILDFKEFQWPENVEFLYTNFLVLVRKDGKVLAHVEFGEEAHLIYIQFFKDDRPSKRLVFDDRGFLSSILYYDDQGKENYQDYLNATGDWQIRENLQTQEVTVNPSVAHRFQKERYGSIAEVIQEKVAAYVTRLTVEDVLVLASSPQHNKLILQAKGSHRLILSYFDERYPFHPMAQIAQDTALADLVVIDRQRSKERLQEAISTPIEHISLFDARLNLGKSQRFRELFLYFLMDGVEEKELLQYLEQIAYFMTEHEDVHLKMVTYQTDPAQEDVKREWLDALLESYDLDFFQLETEEEQTEAFEDDDEEVEIEAKRVSLEFLRSDLDIMSSLEESRLIIDVTSEPDLYTQIAGISAGIPQITIQPTEFVEHLKNGYLLSHPSELSLALHHYLVGLRNWNESLMYAAQKIASYTSGSLVEKIKQSIGYHE
ncbi:accessory Sec system protein Asp1 [Streptococcus himalayensis]|uniref:Accessory Sec system protein Asp1 n=1 Tax=Streptococcus himalayensis TaxID=1888195 RepID=A0A917A904_9STRE|nr:accessory Sec system protein Asp1 [Streptococcus himalayensis]GGE33747.1 accessory Sec system protein Asp1 [Streptococcus himalayensis]